MLQPTRFSLMAFAAAITLAAAAAAQTPPHPRPRPVRVQTVAFQPQITQVTYSGTVQARVQAILGFRVGGKIIARSVNIGDHVTAGQVLARLDPADARLAAEADAQVVRAAEADAVNARVEFDRYQRLGPNSPAWLPSEFDKRRATLDGAEARLAQARRQLALAADQLDYTTLTADADGVITDVRMEVGQVVAAGQTVASLAHTNETEIVVDVPENRLPDVRDAESVTIRVWSLPDVVLHGRTREIGALADSVSRTFAVKVSVLDPPSPDALALGMTAAVSFSRTDGPPGALLPAAAVVSVNGAPSVWVLDAAAQRPVAYPVTIQAWRGDGQVLITGGVADGATVITAGAALLDAATPVTAWAGAIR